MSIFLSLLGSLIIFFGDTTYLLETIHGKVKPNRVTWLIWGIAPMIAFIATISKGVGIISIVTFAFGFAPFLIFFATFLNKQAYWKTTTFDYICGGFSILALVMWFITQEPNVAIAFSILADFLAFIPTYKKALFEPESESSKVYFYCALGSGIALLSLRSLIFAEYAFPLYVFIACLIAGCIIKFKLGKRMMGLKNIAH